MEGRGQPLSFITLLTLSAKITQMLFFLRSKLFLKFLKDSVIQRWSLTSQTTTAIPLVLLWFHCSPRNLVIPNLLTIQILPDPLAEERQCSGWEIQKEIQPSLKMSTLSSGFQINLVKWVQQDSVSFDPIMLFNLKHREPAQSEVSLSWFTPPLWEQGLGVLCRCHPSA